MSEAWSRDRSPVLYLLLFCLRSVIYPNDSGPTQLLRSLVQLLPMVLLIFQCLNTSSSCFTVVAGSGPNTYHDRHITDSKLHWHPACRISAPSNAIKVPNLHFSHFLVECPSRIIVLILMAKPWRLTMTPRLLLDRLNLGSSLLRIYSRASFHPRLIHADGRNLHLAYGVKGDHSRSSISVLQTVYCKRSITPYVSIFTLTIVSASVPAMDLNIYRRICLNDVRSVFSV